MQKQQFQRYCVRCRTAFNYNQPFCSNCGTQQPQLITPVPKKSGLSAWSITTIVLVCSVVSSCALCGLFGAIMERTEKQEVFTVNSTPSFTPTPALNTSPTPEPVGSEDERLQVAAEVRNYLKTQDIPAKVVAAGTKLVVLYTYALAEYDPQDAFLKQQGKRGLQRMAKAGFETLQIEAYDKNNQLQKHTFSLTKYRNIK